MPKIQYKECNFREKSLSLIEDINNIIIEYEDMGYNLTLRQIYYQLVAGDIIENSERSYKNIGTLINNGRLAGLIDWNSVTDRTRNVRVVSHWDSPSDILNSCAWSYRINKWEEQDYYVEVWVEKDALIEIVQKAAKSLDIPCFSCRGYVSQSEMWNAAQRIKNKLDNDYMYAVILHLGDHDPSGIDMSRDIEERLQMFGGFGSSFEINRIALNMDQIQIYNPPPNPAKLTDSRCRGYIKKHGNKSWELDALRPEVLENLIKDECREYMDMDLYKEYEEYEKKEREKLLEIAKKLKEA